MGHGDVENRFRYLHLFFNDITRSVIGFLDLSGCGGFRPAPDLVLAQNISFIRAFLLSSTVIVLKTPKTESSVRKVWMPKTVAYILREWKASQDKQKEFLGSEYLDYNLVVALPNGRPCEETVISNAFRRLKRDAQLPDVVFHSLRHSSTTYKLKLNHGDIKATQGDTGHSQADMVTKVYAHILDEDRKVNAQKFESAFYANPDLRGVQAPAEPAPALDVQSIILQLQQSPELLSALTSLISNQGCK